MRTKVLILFIVKIQLIIIFVKDELRENKMEQREKDKICSLQEVNS